MRRVSQSRDTLLDAFPIGDVRLGGQVALVRVDGGRSVAERLVGAREVVEQHRFRHESVGLLEQLHGVLKPTCAIRRLALGEESDRPFTCRRILLRVRHVVLTRLRAGALDWHEAEVRHDQGHGKRAEVLSHAGGRVGRYEIVGKLATGGMAEVFLARLRGPLGFERSVAIKRILPHLALLPRFSRMFVEEANVVARLSHPNVVHVFELCSEGGELFQVMEYLEGHSVASLLTQALDRASPVPVPIAATIIAQACAGVHAAHELRDARGNALNLVHRDLSPSNLFLTRDGHVKVLDFGVAKIKDGLLRTETGRVKGKGPYMSPEQALAQPLDRTSDVFSLGVVLFELCTATRLFQRENDLLTFRALCDEEIPSVGRFLPNAPAALESILARALSRSPARRFATAHALRRALLELAAADATTAPDELLRDWMNDWLPSDSTTPVLDTLTLTADGPRGKREQHRRSRRLSTVAIAAAGVCGIAVLLFANLEPRADETKQTPRPKAARREQPPRPDTRVQARAGGDARPPPLDRAAPPVLPSAPAIPAVRRSSSGAPAVAPRRSEQARPDVTASAPLAGDFYRFDARPELAVDLPAGPR